jgi:hypothetical protein
MTGPWYALSVRQPWAALLVAGRKAVEVRTWPTKRRGAILIHAGKLPDRRPAAWASLAGDPALRAAAAVMGGVVGVGELADCLTYDTAAAFAADRDRHLNDPKWFRPPRMYGFAEAGVRLVSFFPCVGYTFFFTVKGFEL